MWRYIYRLQDAGASHRLSKHPALAAPAVQVTAPPRSPGAVPCWAGWGRAESGYSPPPCAGTFPA